MIPAPPSNRMRHAVCVEIWDCRASGLVRGWHDMTGSFCGWKGKCPCWPFSKPTSLSGCKLLVAHLTRAWVSYLTIEPLNPTKITGRGAPGKGGEKESVVKEGVCVYEGKRPRPSRSSIAGSYKGPLPPTPPPMCHGLTFRERKTYPGASSCFCKQIRHRKKV